MGDWPAMDAEGAQDRQAGSYTFQTNLSLHPHLPVGDIDCLELFGGLEIVPVAVE